MLVYTHLYIKTITELIFMKRFLDKSVKIAVPNSMTVRQTI